MSAVIYNLGKDATANIEGSSIGFANLDQFDTVANCSLGIEAAEADVSSRGDAGWGAMCPTIRRATVELQMILKKTDTTAAKITAAAVEGTILEAAFLTQAIAVGTAEGIYGEWCVPSYKRGEELEAGVVVDITFKLARFIGWTTDGTDPT